VGKKKGSPQGDSKEGKEGREFRDPTHLYPPSLELVTLEGKKKKRGKREVAKLNKFKGEKRKKKM